MGATAVTGRSGLAAAKSALKAISSSWVHTPPARRCALYAARIFHLVLYRRFVDGVKPPTMLALFQASLVLGLYIFSMPESSTDDEVFALMGENID
ncbi:uncharacterized protein B0I36DRAFT_362381 [Microdochium trichocladiopsis]|uniref:Uncharacterized protein n=1 Tax=Microdochium trichocladiopsis TaxID=1682393 RepID=A0A9P8Y7R5_9PEZI|nr:uncharacterized protein B0I36DRAFT_362381 [Microdochium trichocladiopsis]KAH7033750.1 hypothetical protein B0I36DRAFT_362381 [Microdochium trichocladiopsis]